MKIVAKLLISVGKPFYLFISYSLVFIFFAIYLLGNSLLKFLKLLIDAFSKIKPVKIPLPKISIPKKKIIISLKPRSVIFILGVILVFALFWLILLKDLPSPKQLVTRRQEVSTKIYDRNGVLLYKIFKNENRTLVPLSKIPKEVIHATLAAEDAEFYNHPGFSVKGITRAFINNIKKGKLSGGSTITQQLVKNALLTPEKTIKRKVREIILSVLVEVIYTKDQILEMYLNEVSYGGTAYGIQEAAGLYFSKNVQDLNLPEAALLAGLPKSPSKYSPFGSNPDLSFSRQKEILKLMRINKFISENECEDALNTNILFAANRIDIKAPHFVMYVKQILAEKFGEDLVEKGGLEVITSLDYNIQKTSEKIVEDEIEKLKNLRVGNGAALVVSPTTGEILAMVGSKDYFDLKNGGNFNVTTALRQPGSSIKVINYAYALENGYTLATILDDSPVTFSIPGSPPYSPNNYDGVFRNKLPLRNAFAESRNVPAVKVLAGYGVDKMLEQGKKMGISTWQDPSNYGLSLTLGGGDVKLIDLSRVYATIANYGKRPEIKPILKVTDYKGRIILEEKELEKREKVIDPGVAFLIIDTLKDNNARTPAFGPRSQLVIPDHPEVAVKTGTSNNLKDNLTLGFTQKYLVAVWVGNNDSSPMSKIASGVTGAAPIFNKIMSGLLTDQESYQWPVPENVEKAAICPLTGTLPCFGCPLKEEWFLKENIPTEACVFKKPEIDENRILEEGAKIERD